jgi:hypothetical protein
MQSVHSGKIKRVLEEDGILTWSELQKTTGLNPTQIDRGIKGLGDQVVRTPKKCEVKPGVFKMKMGYALADPAYILHDVQRDLAPLNGLNTTLYMSKKMIEFLGGSVPETWDAVKEWDVRHQPPLPHGLAEASELLYKAMVAFKDWVEEAAEEKVVDGLSESKRRLYREYVTCANYLGFLDRRSDSSGDPRKKHPPADAEVLRALADCLKGGASDLADVPAGKEARQIRDSVLRSPGEDLTKKIKAYVTSFPSFGLPGDEPLRAFDFYFEGWPGRPHSMMEVPLTTWERSEVRRLTRGMHIWDSVQTEKWALLTDLGEDEMVLVRYAKGLEQVRLGEELRKKIDERFKLARSDGSGYSEPLDPFVAFLKSLDRITEKAGRVEDVSDLSLEEFAQKAEEFADKISPMKNLLAALGFKEEIQSIADEYSLESLVLAKLHLSRELLRPRERILMDKLLKLHSPASGKTPAESILQRYPSYKPLKSVSDFVEAKQQLEDAKGSDDSDEELKLYLPETDEELEKALDHYDKELKEVERKEASG